MITAVSFWRRASKSIWKSACYSLLGHYTSYSICLKHIPMSPGTFVSIQMNLCKTKRKFKKTAKHSHLATHSSSTAMLSAVHPALAACEIWKPECVFLGHLPSLHWANQIYQRTHSVCIPQCSKGTVIWHWTSVHAFSWMYYAILYICLATMVGPFLSCPTIVSPLSGKWQEPGGRCKHRLPQGYTVWGRVKFLHANNWMTCLGKCSALLMLLPIRMKKAGLRRSHQHHIPVLEQIKWLLSSGTELWYMPCSTVPLRGLTCSALKRKTTG